MISELFFYIQWIKVERSFPRNPLTHTVTHITIVYNGQNEIFQNEETTKS